MNQWIVESSYSQMYHSESWIWKSENPYISQIHKMLNLFLCMFCINWSSHITAALNAHKPRATLPLIRILCSMWSCVSNFVSPLWKIDAVTAAMQPMAKENKNCLIETNLVETWYIRNCDFNQIPYLRNFFP